MNLPKGATYAFCESVHASGHSLWHIRTLTDEGPKFGGGADTSALCDRKVAWDIDVELTKHHIEKNTCPACQKAYREANA